MSSGKQKKDFVYISDLVDAIMKASLAKGISGQVINIGSGKPTSLLGAIKIMKKLTKGKVDVQLNAFPLREGEPLLHYADIKKAEKLLHWKPETALEEGLNLTFAWWKRYKKQN